MFSRLVGYFSISMMLMPMLVHAGVEIVPLQTNVVDSEKEATLTVENKDVKAILVQVWATPHEIVGDHGEKVPLVFSPPLFKLEPGATQKVRVIYLGGPVVDQKLYRLDVQEVPQAPEKGGAVVQFAFRHILPLTISNKRMTREAMEDAEKSLKWSMGGGNLKLENPTPFVFVIDQITIGESKIKLDENNQFTVSANSSRVIKAVDVQGKIPRASGNEVKFRWFNDMHVPVDAVSEYSVLNDVGAVASEEMHGR